MFYPYQLSILGPGWVLALNLAFGGSRKLPLDHLESGDWKGAQPVAGWPAIAAWEATQRVTVWSWWCQDETPKQWRIELGMKWLVNLNWTHPTQPKFQHSQRWSGVDMNDSLDEWLGDLPPWSLLQLAVPPFYRIVALFWRPPKHNQTHLCHQESWGCLNSKITASLSDNVRL